MGLNSHYFHITVDGHQPYSRGLYTYHKDSLLKVGLVYPQHREFRPWHGWNVSYPSVPRLPWRPCTARKRWRRFRCHRPNRWSRGTAVSRFFLENLVCFVQITREFWWYISMFFYVFFEILKFSCGISIGFNFFPCPWFGGILLSRSLFGVGNPSF